LFPQSDILTEQGAKAGTVIRTLPEFQGKMNRVVGFGPTGPVDEADVRELESTYAAIGLHPEIHLGPGAHPSALPCLRAVGYTSPGILNTYVCSLKNHGISVARQGATAAGPVIQQVSALDSSERFIQASIAGFEDGGRSAHLLRVLAQIATLRADTRLFLATIDGEIAGSAARAVVDTPTGSVGHLYLDSTLPFSRGRGVQAGLIQARLAAAQRLRLSLVTTIARPGTGSARNYEHAGLQLAYTTAIFVPERR
jgi:GNAT superfamily N-acetyltransferase